MNDALPGKRLQNARQSMSLSEQDVARRLHLSVSVIKALEGDDYERLPEPAFVKGYIRNYARLVGVPADEVANLYQQIAAEEQQAPLPVKALQEESVGGKPVWLYGLAALVAVALIWSFVERSSDTPDDAAAPVVEESLPAPSDLDSALDADVITEDALVDMPVEEVVPEPEPEPELAAPAVAQDKLSMRFVEACWLRVVDANGNEIYSGQKPAESVFSLEGEGPFRITLGNAAAVSEINVNGNVVPVPASTPGRVVTVRTPR